MRVTRAGVPQHDHARQTGNHASQQIDPLAGELRRIGEFLLVGDVGIFEDVLVELRIKPGDVAADQPVLARQPLVFDFHALHGAGAGIGEIAEKRLELGYIGAKVDNLKKRFVEARRILESKAK